MDRFRFFNHNAALSSFMTYHCNKSNRIGATCGAGTATLLEHSECDSRFLWGLCCSGRFWHATKEIGSRSWVVHEYEGFQMNLATSDGKGTTATNRGATNDLPLFWSTASVTPGFCGVCVARVFRVMFCRPLFVIFLLAVVLSEWYNFRRDDFTVTTRWVIVV
jgi:hypothetical protein